MEASVVGESAMERLEEKEAETRLVVLIGEKAVALLVKRKVRRAIWLSFMMLSLLFTMVVGFEFR